MSHTGLVMMQVGAAKGGRVAAVQAGTARPLRVTRRLRLSPGAGYGRVAEAPPSRASVVRVAGTGGRNAALYAGGDEFHMSTNPSYDKEMLKFVSGLMWPNLELPLGMLSVSTALAVAVAAMHLYAPAMLACCIPIKSTQPFMAMPLGFLMVFRINQAYTRWWEARGSVGQIMTRSMLLAEIGACGDLPRDSALRIAALCRALLVAIEFEFAIGVKKEDMWDRMGKRVSSEDLEQIKADKGNTVNAVMYMVRAEFSRASSGIDALATKLAANAALLEVHTFLTACRRIFTTPMPISYTAQFRFVLVIYLAAMPFSLIGQVGPYFTIPLNLLICMALIGLDALSGLIINPFGADSDDLPMNRYIKVADENVANIQAKIGASSASW